MKPTKAAVICGLLLFISAALWAQDVSCRVVGVHDGDTLTCLATGNQQIKVRLNQIDAPEKGQDFGNAAGKKLSSLVYGKTVSLKTSGTDRYGRVTADVFSGSLNVNKEMVRTGYAWAYRQYVKDGQYLQLEQQARLSTLGLWSQPNPIYPSEFRKQGRGAGRVSQSVQQKLNTPSGRCGTKRFCTQMTSCSEAKFYLTRCGVSRLDSDGDGVPCESLCK